MNAPKWAQTLANPEVTSIGYDPSDWGGDVRSGGLRSAARAAARRGDWLSAARNYQALAQTRDARVGDRIQLGHALKELGDKDATLAAYAEAARLYPLHLDAQRQYGLFLRRLVRDEDARDVLARALAIDPGASDIAAELEDLGVRDPAALDRHFLRGILGGSDAKAGPASSLLGRLLELSAIAKARKNARAGNWASAEHFYHEALRHAPDRSSVRVQLGHSLLEQGRPEEALAAYRRALVSSPRDPELYLHVGHALKLLGRRDSALESYFTAWRLKPGWMAAFDEVRGICPELDDPARLNGGVGLGSCDARSADGEKDRAGGRRLALPPGLTPPQASTFKYLAGALAYKD